MSEAKWSVFAPRREGVTTTLRIAHVDEGNLITLFNPPPSSLRLAADLVADANRGAGAAAYDVAIDRALDKACEAVNQRSPAWTAANLAREAVLVLTMDRPKDMGDARYGSAVGRLGAALEALQWLVGAESVASALASTPGTPGPERKPWDSILVDDVES